MGRSRQERALEEALSGAVVRGAVEGARHEREAALRDVAASLLRSDVATSRKAVEEHGAEAAIAIIAAAAVGSWATSWIVALGPLILRVMRSAVILTDVGGLTPGYDITNPSLARAFGAYMAERARMITQTTLERITGAIEDGRGASEGAEEITARVETAGNEMLASRPENIARVETLNAPKAASEAQARLSGLVKTKSWHTMRDRKVRPEHKALEGETVALEDTFSDGHVYPSDPNCRCVLVYGMDESAIRRVAV